MDINTKANFHVSITGTDALGAVRFEVTTYPTDLTHIHQRTIFDLLVHCPDVVYVRIDIAIPNKEEM